MSAPTLRDMTRLLLWDETTGGSRAGAGALDGVAERVTAREIIRRRVFEEAARADTAGPRWRARHRHHRDPEAQFAGAVEAFSRNGFVLLVGDRQIDDLDEVLDVRADTEVVFLELVALAGG